MPRPDAGDYAIDFVAACERPDWAAASFDADICPQGICQWA
jgi:hypothetical protein